MASPPPPVKAAAPPPTSNANPASNGTSKFEIVTGRVTAPQRVLIYGTGGIGKSSLARLAPGAVFLDIEQGTRHFEVSRVGGLESFNDLRACLQSTVLDDYQTVVLDTATKAEEMAIAHTIDTVQPERGGKVTSIEGYGFGKGYQHVYDTFLLLLADLDQQIKRGRNVILIAHDCIVDVPNPIGENFIRYEPHLQSPKSGKASIRNRVVQWADHVLFIGYDVNATKEGKGQGSGTRTIWALERPDHIAKSRSLKVPSMQFKDENDGKIWSEILNGGAA